MLKLSDITVWLGGKEVLQHIRFSLQPQEHLVITGRSGSGKTTLLQVLNGQVLYSGTVALETADGRKPLVVFVAQQHRFRNLFNLGDFYYQQRYNSSESEDALTVWEELKACVEKQAPFDAEAAETVLEMVQLSSRRDAPVIQLSGGEHKRVQLAAACLCRAELVLLDNPFTGLDSNGKILLHDILNRMAATGVQLVMVTNEAAIPACITHRLHLHEGRQVFFGKKEAYNAETSAGILPPARLPALQPFPEFREALRMVNVIVAYNGKTILKELNWTVKRGERWQLKGKNGAGKSTLLSLVTGDNPQAYANELYLFDKRRGSGESIWDIKKRIGYMSPDIQWYFPQDITVAHAVGSGFFDTMGLFKKLNEAQTSLIRHWLCYFDLEKEAAQRLSSLPAGRQRMVMLVRALVKSPALLILDEPCHGLDEEQSARFIAYVDALMEQTDTTLIYVTHNEDEVPHTVTKQLTLSV